MHKANESQAAVEFLPYQELPLKKRKADGRNATFDQGTVVRRGSLDVSPA
jgi:hypothetical protein